MNWLKKLFCDHQWRRTYSYSSFKDSFAGEDDKSGIVYIDETCQRCCKERIRVTVFDKKGKLEREYVT
jgi:hypothetical protein